MKNNVIAPMVVVLIKGLLKMRLAAIAQGTGHPSIRDQIAANVAAAVAAVGLLLVAEVRPRMDERELHEVCASWVDAMAEELVKQEPFAKEMGIDAITTIRKEVLGSALRTTIVTLRTMEKKA